MIRSYVSGFVLLRREKKGRREKRCHINSARRLSRAGLEPTLSSRPTARTDLRILKRLCRHSFAEASHPAVFLVEKETERERAVRFTSSRKSYDYYRLASVVTSFFLWPVLIS